MGECGGTTEHHLDPQLGKVLGSSCGEGCGWTASSSRWLQGLRDPPLPKGTSFSRGPCAVSGQSGRIKDWPSHPIPDQLRRSILTLGLPTPLAEAGTGYASQLTSPSAPSFFLTLLHRC